MFNNQSILTQLQTIPAEDYPLAGGDRADVKNWLRWVDNLISFYHLFGDREDFERLITLGHTLLALLKAQNREERDTILDDFANGRVSLFPFDFAMALALIEDEECRAARVEHLRETARILGFHLVPKE